MKWIVALVGLVLALVAWEVVRSREQKLRSGIAVNKAKEAELIPEIRVLRDTVRVLVRVTDTLVRQSARAKASADSQYRAIPPETLAVTPVAVLALIDTLRRNAVRDSATIATLRLLRGVDTLELGKTRALAEQRLQIYRKTEKLVPSRARVWTERGISFGLGFAAGQYARR